MAASYTALAATIHRLLSWAADAHAKIELIDKHACWIDVIALTDADAARMLQIAQSQASRLADDADTTRMLQTLQRMARVLQQRLHLGAALLQQRFLTHAALGSFSVLSTDDLQLIVRLASVRGRDRAAIARASSSFCAHARSAAVMNDQAWAAQAASLRLLTSLKRLVPLPPGSLCELYLRLKQFERPPPPEFYPGEVIADFKGVRMGGCHEFRVVQKDQSTQYDLSDFLIFVEFWWDGKLFGATCGELGRNLPVRQKMGRIIEADIGNVFGGPEYRDVPFCFAHDTDRSNLDWETCFLRIFVCDKTSYTTRLIYVGGLDDGHLSDGDFSVFESGSLMGVENEQGGWRTSELLDTTYTICPSLDKNTLPLESSETPLGGRLRLEFMKRTANSDPLHVTVARHKCGVSFSADELASVLAVLTLTESRRLNAMR